MNKDREVCKCNKTTVGQIEAAVQAGARTYEEVKEKTGVGRQCIMCKDYVQMIIDSLLEED